MYYLVFCSASKDHIDWLRETLTDILGVRGHVNGAGSIWQLKYAKKEAAKPIAQMYPTEEILCLKRKRLKIEKMLAIMDEHLPRKKHA